MAGIKQVSFTSPYSAEEAEIARARKMAELLQAKGQEGLGPTEMVGGWAIPRSPMEGLGKVAQQVSGAYQQKQATERAKALQERQQGDRTADMSALAAALRGREAIPAPADELGGGPGAPAQPGGQIDPAMLGSLKSPEMQNMGMQMWLQQMQRENAPPERVDLGDRIGLVKNGQIVGFLPKGATPDAALREKGAGERHLTPSGSAQLGAQTTLQTHATPSGGAILADQRARSEGALGRGQALTIAQMGDARARETAGAGKVPPGYRATAEGGLEAIPGGPADEKEAKKTGEIKKAVDMYVAARDGLISGLEGTQTGPVSGRIPAVTTGQQVAEGGVAAMAPVLKQLFRVSGEGVFTDRDQALLLDMVPKRTDHPAARAEKMANIDKIVSAKLGQDVPARARYAGPERRAGSDDPLGIRKK